MSVKHRQAHRTTCFIVYHHTYCPNRLKVSKYFIIFDGLFLLHCVWNFTLLFECQINDYKVLYWFYLKSLVHLFIEFTVSLILGNRPSMSQWRKCQQHQLWCPLSLVWWHPLPVWRCLPACSCNMGDSHSDRTPCPPELNDVR